MFCEFQCTLAIGQGQIDFLLVVSQISIYNLDQSQVVHFITKKKSTHLGDD